MNLVSDIMASKGSAVVTVDRSAMVLDAIRKMVSEGIGALIVTDGDAIHGIFTERDYLRRIALEGRTSKTTPVGEVATERLIVVEPSNTLEDCMALMTSERVRHLPVLDKGSLSGIVSVGDIVKHMSKQQAAEIRYLTDYITGKYPG